LRVLGESDSQGIVRGEGEVVFGCIFHHVRFEIGLIIAVHRIVGFRSGCGDAKLNTLVIEDSPNVQRVGVRTAARLDFGAEPIVSWIFSCFEDDIVSLSDGQKDLVCFVWNDWDKVCLNHVERMAIQRHSKVVVH
jgi:hypothetical protein